MGGTDPPRGCEAPMDNATFFLIATLGGILIFGLLYLITMLWMEGPLD